MNVELAIRDWHWEVTKKCNLKCLHCIIGDRFGYEMTTEEAFVAISRIVKLGGKRLFITGGEPLMRNDICLIIKKARRAGLVINLISNGTKIDRRFLNDIGDCVQGIAISIDGSLLIQDKIRGSGVYNKCVNAIQLILDYNINVSVYSTINSLNEAGIGEFLESMISLGVRSFHFNEINPDGRARDNEFLLLQPRETKDRADSILLQLRDVIEIDKFDVNTSCSIYPETVYMQSDGTIFSCVELAFRSPSYVITNIIKEAPERVKDSVENYFVSTQFCENVRCCYTSYLSPGLNVTLNEREDCPVIRRIDNEY